MLISEVSSNHVQGDDLLGEDFQFGCLTNNPFEIGGGNAGTKSF